MIYVVKLFGLLPLVSLTISETSTQVIYNTGGNFEIAPEPVEEEYEYEEEYRFGFGGPT